MENKIDYKDLRETSYNLYNPSKKEGWTLGICLGLLIVAIFFLNIYVFGFQFLIPAFISVGFVFAFGFTHEGSLFKVPLKMSSTLKYITLLFKPPFKGVMGFWRAFLYYLSISIIASGIGLLIALKGPLNNADAINLIDQIKQSFSLGNLEALRQNINNFYDAYGEILTKLLLPSNIIASLAFIICVSYNSLGVHFVNHLGIIIGPSTNKIVKNYMRNNFKGFFLRWLYLNHPIIVLFLLGNLAGYLIVDNTPTLDYSYFVLLMPCLAVLFITPFLAKYFANQEAIYAMFRDEAEPILLKDSADVKATIEKFIKDNHLEDQIGNIDDIKIGIGDESDENRDAYDIEDDGIGPEENDDDKED